MADEPFYFVIFGLIWIINIISTISIGVLQGFQKYRFVTHSIALGVTFVTISYLILVFTKNLSLLNVAVVLLISELLKGVIAFFYMLYLLKNFEILDVEMNLNSKQISKERKDLIKVNIIFMFLNLSNIFIFYYDKILIYIFLNSYTELAYYFLAGRYDEDTLDIRF